MPSLVYLQYSAGAYLEKWFLVGSRARRALIADDMLDITFNPSCEVTY